MTASGQVASDVLGELKSRMQAFSSSRAQLTKLHPDYLQREQALTLNSSTFEDFLVVVERISSEEMLRQDMNSVSDSDSAADEGQDRWASINASGETKLALLTRLELYRRFKEETDVSEIFANIKLLYDDLAYAIDTIGEDPLFDQQLMSGRNAEYGTSKTQYRNHTEHLYVISYGGLFPSRLWHYYAEC